MAEFTINPRTAYGRPDFPDTPLVVNVPENATTEDILRAGLAAMAKGPGFLPTASAFTQRGANALVNRLASSALPGSALFSPTPSAGEAAPATPIGRFAAGALNPVRPTAGGTAANVAALAVGGVPGVGLKQVTMRALAPAAAQVATSFLTGEPISPTDVGLTTAAGFGAEGLGAALRRGGGQVAKGEAEALQKELEPLGLAGKPGDIAAMVNSVLGNEGETLMRAKNELADMMTTAALGGPAKLLTSADLPTLADPLVSNSRNIMRGVTPLTTAKGAPVDLATTPQGALRELKRLRQRERDAFNANPPNTILGRDIEEVAEALSTDIDKLLPKQVIDAREEARSFTRKFNAARDFLAEEGFFVGTPTGGRVDFAKLNAALNAPTAAGRKPALRVLQDAGLQDLIDTIRRGAPAGAQDVARFQTSVFAPIFNPGGPSGPLRAAVPIGLAGFSRAGQLNIPPPGRFALPGQLTVQGLSNPEAEAERRSRLGIAGGQ